MDDLDKGQVRISHPPGCSGHLCREWSIRLTLFVPEAPDALLYQASGYEPVFFRQRLAWGRTGGVILLGMCEPAAPHRPLSVEEYLELERTSERRHEYVAGEIHAHAGGTRRHDVISGNIFASLWNAAQGGPCRVHTSDRLLRAAEDVFYYTDVMVVRSPENDARGGDALFEDAPCLVVEVTSPPIEAIDRREKMLAYRRIPSLRAYVVADGGSGLGYPESLRPRTRFVHSIDKSRSLYDRFGSLKRSSPESTEVRQVLRETGAPSKYASQDPLEFVAEVYAGRAAGRNYPAKW